MLEIPCQRPIRFGSTSGPIAVDLARVVVAAQRGGATEAVQRRAAVMRRKVWLRLPAEYRGAYLID
ncbi:hypothetical protein AB0H57_32510, partial [Micromonospora sp. NPDC050686]